MQISNQGQNIYEQVEAMLSSMQVGDIASDHRAELQGFNGWNYVAITAVAKQATRSLIYVYDDSNPEYREMRKAFRLKYGHEWRKALVREHQGQVVDARHPLVKLLKRPNPFQSGGSFRWEQVQQMRLHGSCLVFNRPNVLMNRTVERYVIPLALVTPIKPGRYRNMPRGGITINPSSWNSFVAAGGSKAADAWSSIQQFINVQLPIERMTIVKYPHPHFKGDGASPTTAASRWIDAGATIDESRDEFYQDGAYGKILVTTEETDPARIADLEERLSRSLGPDGPRVTVVGNTTAIASKRTADEMAFTEGHDQMRDGVLAAHGVNRAMVGSQDGMTYGSLAAALLGSTMLSIQPDMDLIADEETLDLGPEYGENICIEYEVPGINDPEMEERRLEMDSRMGVMTVGEYRMKRGEPLFGTAYDNYILTSSGPVEPSSVIKVTSSVEQPVADVPAQEFPAFEEVKALRYDDEQEVILIDETILDTLDQQVADAFSLSGFTFKPLMDDGKEPTERDKMAQKAMAVWDWSYGGDVGMFIKSLPKTPKQQKLEKAIEQVVEKTREYGCILFTTPDDMTKRFLQEVNGIPKKMLADGGCEMEPHVTALYGILGVELDEVVRIVSKIESPLVKFGKTSSFPGGDAGVPLFVTVESEDMHNINTQLRSLLPHVVKFPEYTPHATLAYVKDAEGLANKRCSLTGKSCYLGTAIISMPGKDKVVVPLRRPYIASDIELVKPMK